MAAKKKDIETTELVVKLGTFFIAKGALSKLMNFDLPVRMAFRLGRLLKIANEALGQLEEQRQKLVTKYGVAVDNGVEVPIDKMGEFQKEFNELLNETITVDFIPVSLADLGDDIKLSAMELASLEQFVTE